MGGCVSSGTVAEKEPRDKAAPPEQGPKHESPERGGDGGAAAAGVQGKGATRQQIDAKPPLHPPPPISPHPIFVTLSLFPLGKGGDGDADADAEAVPDDTTSSPIALALDVLEKVHKSGLSVAILKSNAKSWNELAGALGVDGAACLRLVHAVKVALDEVLYAVVRPAMEPIVKEALQTGDPHSLADVLSAVRTHLAGLPGDAGYPAADVHYNVQVLMLLAPLARTDTPRPPAEVFYVDSLSYIFSALRGSVVKPSTGMVSQRQLQSGMVIFRELLLAVGVLFGDVGDDHDDDAAVTFAWFDDLPVLLLDAVAKSYLLYANCAADQQKLALPALRRHEIVLDAMLRAEGASAMQQNAASAPHGGNSRSGSRASSANPSLRGRRTPAPNVDGAEARGALFKLFPTFQDANGVVEAGEGHGPRKELFELLAHNFTRARRPERDASHSMTATLKEGSYTAILIPSSTEMSPVPASLPVSPGSIVRFKGIADVVEAAERDAGAGGGDAAKPVVDAGADAAAAGVPTDRCFSAVVTAVEVVMAARTEAAPQDGGNWGNNSFHLSQLTAESQTRPASGPISQPDDLDAASSLEYSMSTINTYANNGTRPATGGEPSLESRLSISLKTQDPAQVLEKSTSHQVPTLHVTLDRSAPHDGEATGVLLEAAQTPLFMPWDGQAWWFNSAFEDGPVDAQTLNAYHFAGWAMAQGVGNGLALNLALPVMFYYLLQHWEIGKGCEVSCETVEAYPCPLLDTVKQIEGMSEADYRAMLEAEGVPYGMSLSAYLAAYLKSFLIDSVMSRMDMFVTGFRSTHIDQDPIVKRLLPAELAMIVQGRMDDGARDFVYADEFILAATSDFRAAPHNEVFLKLIWEVIEEGLGAAPGQQASRKRAFLKFLTGRSTLSAYAKCDTLTLVLPYTVFNADVFDKHLNRLPMSHTCDNTMELPNYMESLLFGTQSPWYALADVRVGASIQRRHREACWPLLSEEQRSGFLAELRAILVDRLSTAAFNTDSYELDETDDYDGA